MMQADGTRQCKFGKNYYQNSDNWHPRVPLVGEMKCITCWCDVSMTRPKRKEFDTHPNQLYLLSAKLHN